MKHIEHTPNEFTDSYNVDCKCPECIDIAWDKQCINCNLLQRDCYGQEHGPGEDIFNYRQFSILANKHNIEIIKK